jgi:hypothetical protein
MINCYYNSKLFSLPLLKNYSAITLPWGIYFKQDQSKVPYYLIHHEEIHLEQRQRYTILGFYCLYAWYYLKGLYIYRNHDIAYRNNPLEIEAYYRQNEKV